MAAHEGIDYDPADGHYSDVVLTIRILMGKVQIYEFILPILAVYLYILMEPMLMFTDQC